MTATARERVHAMEALAAIIAHELRAGVVGVTSAAQLLRYSVPADPVAEKSLGRILQEGARRVSIQGEDIQVRARIRALDVYSGHADAAGLTA